MPGAWSVLDTLDGPTMRQVRALLADAAERADDEALTEDHRERLDAGDRVRHVLRREGADLVGYAVLLDGEVLEAEPVRGTYDPGLPLALEGLGRPVRLLLRPADDAVTAALADRGWRVVRGLRRMRRPLPAEAPPPTTLVVRPFEVGRDEDAWLAQNNAAFAGHPTQSRMTRERLAARVAQPWFDAAGFLLFFDGDALAASCWTKVHRHAHGDMGEIYVISVAPFAQGRGLGVLAVRCGLAHLSAAGLGEAELFVEEGNVGAIALYERLGFTTASRVVELGLGLGGAEANDAHAGGALETADESD